MDLSIAGEPTDGSLPTHRPLNGRALWWVSALLLAGMIAIVLPIGQIKIRGAQLGGIIGSYDYGHGQYVVSYSGGTGTSKDDTGTYPGQVNNGSVSANTGGANASADCSGPITATFIWNSGALNDPPPDSVIVQENSAAWTYGSTTATGSVNDGMGHVSTASSTSTSLSVSGVRYSVVNQPGSYFTTFVNSTASAASATGGAGAGLDYKATTWVAWINLSGTTPIKDAQGAVLSNNVLIGQRLGVGMNIFGLTLLPSDTRNTWEWTLTGDPFEGFAVSANSTTGKATEFTDITPDPRSTIAFSYFYRSIGSPDATIDFLAGHNTQTITCKETVYFPDNTAKQVTTHTTVDVYQPAHTMLATGGKVATFVDAANQASFGAGPRAPDPAVKGDVGSPRGSNWTGSVTTPYCFNCQLPQNCRQTQTMEHGNMHRLYSTQTCRRPRHKSI